MIDSERRSQARSPRISRWLLSAVLVSASLTTSRIHAQATGQIDMTANANVEVNATAQPSADATTQEQAQSRDQEARRLFEAGRTAYVEEKYQDALNYFEQAHELSHRPQLLFNIGQASDRLGQRQRAAQSFRAYLTAMPDAGNREEIETRIRELEASGTPTDSETMISDGRAPRSGLYVRGAVGVGIAHDAFARNTSLGLPSLEGNASGGSLAIEFAVGHALRPGLALAAVLALEWAQVDRIEVQSIEIEDGQVGLLGMLGGMIDWYIDPAQGGHLQAGLVLARMPVKGGDSAVDDHDSFGGGLLLGGGYEWSLRRGLAIGVLGRLTLAQLKGDDYTHNMQALSVLCSVSMY